MIYKPKVHHLLQTLKHLTAACTLWGKMGLYEILWNKLCFERVGENE